MRVNKKIIKILILMVVLSVFLGLGINEAIDHFELTDHKFAVLVRDLAVFLPLAYAIGAYYELR
ncbi:hypothetical protein DFR28_1195 [Arenicella xantha]|uniref:Uncharacterized protein n=1 Tax=Arenicella xantha TaxID=644221 RepID=A0A395JHH9_9GAMM|nr:hypothetical protein DFR28_1195 [Arenicella xantha]